MINFRAIRHPNIVTFLGVCQHQNVLYVVTEFVSRGDLTHELQRDKPISWRQRVLYAKDACAAIAYLHQLGIIHRYHHLLYSPPTHPNYKKPQLKLHPQLALSQSTHFTSLINQKGYQTR